MWDFILISIFLIYLKQSPVLQNKGKPLFLNILLNESRNENLKNKPSLHLTLQRKIKTKILVKLCKHA